MDHCVQSALADGNAGRPTVDQLFRQVCRERPQAIAATQEGCLPLSYAELERRSALVARSLAANGVIAGDLVALCAGRSIETVIAIVGIVRSGAAYVPIDPAYPDVKLAEMIRDVSARIVLAEPAQMGRIGRLAGQGELPADTKAVDFSAPETLCDEAGAALASVAIDPDSPIYAMFTSGSTGRAKAVLVPHGAVSRLVHGQDYCQLGPGEVVLHLAPLNFDASTFEIWGALLNGGQLAIVADAQPSACRIASAIREHGVTTAWLTAGLFHLLVDTCLEAVSGLDQLLAGGDVLSPAHVRRFQAAAPNCRLINGYGPTENTTFTCCCTVPAGEWLSASVPIGRSIAGTQVFIVDEEMQPVAPGTAGQLVAAGDGLAIGYLGNPELTRERFVEAPTPIDRRVYLTGDLVRELPDGQIEFLGRIDNQIKIDGKRVEPGEIEDALRRCDGVADAAVAVRKTATGVQIVLGFVVAGAPVAQAAHAQIRGLLPEHMWPNRVVALDALPVTRNGKVDRAGLLDLAAARGAASHAPQNEIEAQVLALWRDALGIEDISRDDAFFDLGGRSLQLMQVHAGLQRLSPSPVAVADLFAHPTVRGMAELLAPNSAGQSTAPAVGDLARERARLRRAAVARRARPGFRVQV